MELYTVWISHYNCDDEPCFGDDDIVGVYSNELTAYQVACVKQVKLYSNPYELDDETDGGNIMDWLEENIFPSNDDDLQTWKTYFENLTDDETIKYIKDCTRTKDVDYDILHVTRVVLDSIPILKFINFTS